MAVLRLAAAAAALAGCYSPAFRDCVTACELDADCAPGQACGGDGLCAAPERAGSCATLEISVDASPADAPMTHPVDASPDARPGPMVELHVRIEDKGVVDVEGVGTCSSEGAQHGDCRFQVRAFVQLALRAEPAVGRSFDRWSSLACGGQGADCSLSLALPAEVRARFRKDGP